MKRVSAQPIMTFPSSSPNGPSAMLAGDEVFPRRRAEIPLPRDRSGLNELMFRSMKAYSHGYQGTAMKYAKRALLSMPFNPRVWRMALVVVLGPHLRRFRAASHANRGKSDG